MALETLAGDANEIQVGGHAVKLKLVGGFQVIRLLKLLDTIKGALGLSAEELGKMEFSFGTIAQLVGRVHEALILDVDIENTDPLDPAPQMGPLARLFYKEVGAVFGLRAEEFAALSVADQFDLIRKQIELEEGTALGNVLRGMYETTTSYLRMVVNVSGLPQTPTGSQTPSGSTQSSVQSAAPSPLTPSNQSSPSPSSES